MKKILCVQRDSHFGPRVTSAAEQINIRSTTFEEISKSCIWMDRNDELENDQRFLQIIPYVILRKGLSFFTYSRMAGDKRLSNRVSIGIGGHVEWCDRAEGEYRNVDFVRRTIINCAKRELREEIGCIVDDDKIIPFLVVFDGTDHVGSVHLGIACMVDWPLEQNPMFGEEVSPIGWLDAMKIREYADRGLAENWTKMCIPHLYSGDLILNTTGHAP